MKDHGWNAVAERKPEERIDYLTWWETYDGGDDGPYIAFLMDARWYLRDDDGSIRHLKTVIYFRELPRRPYELTDL